MFPSYLVKISNFFDKKAELLNYSLKNAMKFSKSIHNFNDNFNKKKKQVFNEFFENRG